jgi:hypothetical protein
MRTEKELFELMLTRQDLFTAGICGWSFDLCVEGLITYNEYDLLIDYLELNGINSLKVDYYWWEIGKIKPRIEWIKQQIEKL